MSVRSRRVIAALTVCAAMAIYTFGHSMNHSNACSDPACLAITAIYAASFWPLYWSAELQKPDGEDR